MACSWEIDAQGSYGLYLNMIIYRVDANEDTKYNHFAYYTNQDRKSKRYLRFGKPKNLVCSLTLSIFELDIDSWYFFSWSKRTDGPWNSTKTLFFIGMGIQVPEIVPNDDFRQFRGNLFQRKRSIRSWSKRRRFLLWQNNFAGLNLWVINYDLSESFFKFWEIMLGHFGY